MANETPDLGLSAPDATGAPVRTEPALPVLTMGDPAGIGPEITLRAYAQRRARNLPPFAIYADPDMLAARAAAIGENVELAIISDPREALSTFETRLPVVPVRLSNPAIPGTPDSANAASVITSIEAATDAVRAGAASALVTNPIAKAVLYAAGFSHPGHTEFLAHLADLENPGAATHPVMMLASDELRVIPVTIHIPLTRVAPSLSQELIVRTVRITASALQRYFGIANPRIRVAGLNPHAGEDGSLGSEDQEIIAPAIAELRTLGIDVSGPSPADTMFHEAARQTYDAAVAMYHDQALIPIKTLAFDRGVNVTLGLPFIRTSPDHGTAFDIAGRGTASPESLISAINMAVRMADAARTGAQRTSSAEQPR